MSIAANHLPRSPAPGASTRARAPTSRPIRETIKRKHRTSVDAARRRRTRRCHLSWRSWCSSWRSSCRSSLPLRAPRLAPVCRPAGREDGEACDRGRGPLMTRVAVGVIHGSPWCNRGAAVSGGGARAASRFARGEVGDTRAALGKTRTYAKQFTRDAARPTSRKPRRGPRS